MGNNEEVIIMKAKPHWMIFIPPLFVGVLLGLLGVMLEPLFMLLALAYIILREIPLLIRYLSTELVISSKRIHGKYGLLSVKQLDSPINKVDNVSVDMKLLGRLFGYGNICISTNSGRFVFSSFGHPETIKNTIIQAQDDYEEGRFTRQSERYEQAMERQTMAQAAMFGGLAQSMQQVAAVGTAASLQQTARLTAENREQLTVQETIPQSQQNHSFIQPEPVRQVSRPVSPGNLRDKTVLKEIPHALWQEGCPIMITKGIIADKNDNGVIDLTFEIKNLTDKVVEAVFMDIRGLNVLKEEKCYLEKMPIIDLRIEPNTRVMVKSIDLPDNSIRQIKVTMRNVVFTDESVWAYDGGNELEGIELKQETIPRAYAKDMDALCAEITANRHTGRRYPFYPVFEDNYWICACGQFNTGDRCSCCKEEKQIIKTYICEQILAQRNRKRMEREEEERKELEAQRAERERLAREKEEQARELAEQERLRKEQERREKLERFQSSAKGLMTMAGQKSKEAGGKIKQAVGQVGQQSKQWEDRASQPEPLKPRFCSKCGTRLDGQSAFCPECGQRVEG